MSELTPLHVLADLFDDGDLPVPNPEAAAAIVTQRLIDARFEIKARSVTASGWRHTLGGCSDNNWRGLSIPRCLL